MRRFLLAGLVMFSASLMVTGCLSRSHVIPKRDLMALSTTPPEARGQRVRVVQSFAHEAGPPERADNGGAVIIGGPVRTRRGGIRGGGGRGGKGSKIAKMKADDAKAWFIAAIVVAAALAATEGARFDGWVNLNPGHPVYLFGYGGQYQIVRLRDITPEQASWARKAMVHPRDGTWRELERAPLNRQGWTYSVFGGAAQIPGIDGGLGRGFLGHIQFGYFFSESVGLNIDFGMGWRDNSLDQTIFESRNSLELQVLPLAAGIVHAGGYASVGYALQVDDRLGGGSRSSQVFAGGGMLQLELTTRLAFTARAGFANLQGHTVNEVAFGVSIY